MEQIELGKLIKDIVQSDAIHIATCPITAADDLEPGQHIGLLTDDTASWRANEMIGVVDPFLIGTVKKGQRFFMLMYPYTITGLRHVWTHPAFERMKDQTAALALLAEAIKARAVIEDIAQQGETSAEYLIKVCGRGEEPCFGTEMYDVNPAQKSKFWDAIEVLTGYKHPEERRDEYWRCSC